MNEGAPSDVGEALVVEQGGGGIQGPPAHPTPARLRRGSHDAVRRLLL